MRGFYRPLGIAVAVLGLAALAGPAIADKDGPNEHANWHAFDGRDGVSAPEIGPGMLTGTVALLASGFLMLRDRKRR
jgi:hypothetical protein